MTTQNLQNIIDSTIALQEEMDQDADQINTLIDLVEERDAQILQLEQKIARQDHILDKQHLALEKSNAEYSQVRNNLMIANTELSELRKIDPVRLVKVNKTQKVQVAELKKKLADVEAKRKLANKQTKEMEQRIKVEGAAPLFVCPETGNAVRILPGLRVAAGNKQGGVANTPVLEYMYSKEGITQQGFLIEDGSIAWADTTVVSKPDATHSSVALKAIHDFCKSHKIKVK